MDLNKTLEEANQQIKALEAEIEAKKAEITKLKKIKKAIEG